MTHSPPHSSDERTSRSRYPGIRPFNDSAEDCNRFFGRTKESEELYLRVLSVPLLLQFAKSGLGKTSLLQAGLFPLLRKEPFLPVMVRLNDVGEPLTVAVARSIQQACVAERLEHTEGQREGLWELLLTTIVSRGDLMLTPVLVFDQFEEVFTLRDAAFHADLARELGALASGRMPERLQAVRSSTPNQFGGRPECRIVISLREDYLAFLEELSTAIPGLFDERLRLGSLTESEARNAIIMPALLVAGAGEEPYWSPSFKFEDTVLDNMIRYLKGSAGIIEPFQLQLLCRHAEVIARAKAGTGEGAVTLTLADFSGKQDFATVLTDFYRDTMSELSSSQRKKAKELCEEGLLDASGHRRMLEEGQIRREFGIKADTLTTLSNSRLIRRERRLESVFYEISHDRLAESIVVSRPAIGKKLRRMFWSIGVVIFVILIIAAFHSHSVQQERDRAVVAEGQAIKEKQKAESLLSFLLGEQFLDQIRDVGRSTMLEEVRDHVGKYLGANDQGIALIRGLALRNAGDVKRTQGLLDEPIRLFEQALQLIESSPGNPGDLDRQREIARTRDRLGEALADQGDVSLAIDHYEAAVKAWEQVAKDAKSEVHDCTSLADSLVMAGYMRNRMGEANHALVNLQEAMKITSTVLFVRPSSDKGCGPVANEAAPYPDPKGLEVFSHALLLRAFILNFKEDLVAPVALAKEAEWWRPNSASATTNALTSRSWQTNGLIFETPQSALKEYRDLLTRYDMLQRLDPNNRLGEREREAGRLLVAEGIMACHGSKGCKPMPSLEEANATSLEVIGTLNALAQIDTTNTSLQRDLSWAWRVHGKVLLALNQRAEGLAALETSEQIDKRVKLDDKNAADIGARGDLLMDKAGALAMLGRQAESKAALDQAIDLFKRRIADHPDNLAYRYEMSGTRKREAEIRRKVGDWSGADAAAREVAPLEKQSNDLLASYQDEPTKLTALLVTSRDEGINLFENKQYADALHKFKAAESSMRKCITLWPTDSEEFDSLRDIYKWIQATYEKLDNVEDRGAALISSMRAAQVAWLLESEAEKPRNEMHEALRLAQQQLGIFLRDNGRFKEALAIVQEEIRTATSIVSKYPKRAELQWSLGNAKFGLSMVRRNSAEHKEGWEEAIRSGLIDVQKAADIDRNNPGYQNDLGMMRRYLAEELLTDGLEGKAQMEYRLALKAYQQAARLSPGDKTALNSISELDELGVW